MRQMRRAIIGRPSPWPRSSVCALSPLSVIRIWPSCSRTSVQGRLASIGSPLWRCTAKWRSERTREHRQREPTADNADDCATKHELECPYLVSQRGGDRRDQNQERQRIGNGGR